ncbi:MAG: class I SAM-dependent methyltransferase, partial [bacterium]
MFELEKIPGIGAIFYNAVAAKGFMGLYQRIAKEIVTEIKSGKVLDIGTGPGYLPIEIAKLNNQLEIIGVDLSHRMINIAHKNARIAKIDRVKFEVANAHDLPYQNNSFDFVFSTLSLHHWRDRIKVFNECSRIVKNGGLVWIYDFRKDATRKEIKKTIGVNGANFRHFYLSFSLRFHGLKTEEYFS